MRFLARLAAIFAAFALAPVAMVWDGARWIRRLVSRPDPVLPTAAAAEDYLDAAAAAAPAAPVPEGIRACHPVGMALVLHARHVTAGGDPVDLAGLPADVATWLHSLAPDELAVLARTMPHQAQALTAGTGRVPGLAGPYEVDMSAALGTHPHEDADVSEPAFSRPYRGAPGDSAMRDLLAHVEAIRVRQVRVA
ncbi:hypothetical protein PQI07_16280 [Methylobacterium sp. 092160098-2]|uniref:hypothetical protein n=1 Tax=Methylobacterium sp. 092160098-2 TaxID=3025129 RepID=UPI002381A914|nr:hypothetical protein [Methylobacterium sp. 092160098-2]MDE4912239.1 hypothetical protein [Methylobacterium sp. 092160098-2]